MAGFSIHGFSFFRHGRGRTIVTCYYVFIIYFTSVKCASITNSSEELEKDVKVGKDVNETISQRNILRDSPYLAYNPYVPNLSIGFPAYQSPQQTPPFLYPQISAVASNNNVKKPAATNSQKKRLKVKTRPGAGLEHVSSEDPDEQMDKIIKAKTKQKNEKKKKLENEAEVSGKVESKTVADEGTERGCPACIGGECNPTLDPSTNISGIPVIQILVALVVGAFWAAVFAFVLHNFIDYDHHKNSGGYGYGSPPTPQYGAPVSEYGAPQYGAPQPEYGTPTGYSNNHRVSYGNGRSSQGYTFNDMSNWVWNAIDKLASKYDN